MLVFIDILLTLVHLAIIGFNLTGWIWPRTRRAHLAVVCLTAFCWLVLGIWHGLGYCPVTDWQWQVKEQLGVRNLPASFITWFMQRITGISYSPAMIDLVTAGSFITVAVLSIYLNLFRGKRA